MTDDLPSLDAPVSAPYPSHADTMHSANTVNGHIDAVANEDTYKNAMVTGLEQARVRLLNLTLRNRLLNISSTQCLQIIDVAPDLIFQKLRNSQELRFRSLPPVTPGQIPTQITEELPRLTAGSSEWEQHQAREYVQSSLELNPLIFRLKKIHTTTKSMMDEMGISTLYLVFGFLEWRETNEANTTHIAPLILFPIALRKGQAAQQHNIPYYLKYSEEDIEVNLTLRLKLKIDFGIDLLEFTDNEAPESYFEKVRQQIEHHQAWRIRRQMAIANLSFHKLRMWQDLDPNAWPGNELLEHPLIRDFIVGRPVGDRFSSEDYALDAPSLQPMLPPLIEDADSSQHSALLDVMQGKNLVIEGPPGTGKSQTITNLIAAAMAQGKTILFVAEKKAALDVVEARLKRAGLGEFCLELHSNKVRTSNLSRILDQRLSQRGHFETPTSLKEKKEQFEADKKRLIEYVETVNRRFGVCGQRLQQILGCRELLRNGFSFDISRIDSITLSNADQLTLMDVYRVEEYANFYAMHWGRIASRGKLHSHPWYGLNNHQLSPEDERLLLTALGEMRTVLSAIMHQIDSLRVETGMRSEDQDALLDELLGLEARLPGVPPEIRSDLLAPLADPSRRRQVQELGADVEHYHELRTSVELRLGSLPDLTPDEVEMLDRTCQQASEIGLGTKTILELRQEATWIRSFADYLIRVASFVENVGRHLACPIPFDTEGVLLLTKAIPLIRESPESALALRNPILEQEGISTILLQAYAEAERLRNKEKDISQKIDLNLAPPVEKWAPHAVASANAGLFSLVTREYRTARRDWRGMSKRARMVTGLQMAGDFRTLIQYKQDLDAFTSNELYRERLGPLFLGVRTNFSELINISRWYDAIREKLGMIPDAARQIAAALIVAPAGNLMALREFIRNHNAEIERLERVFGNFQAHLTRLPKAWRREPVGNLSQFADRLRDLASHLEAQIAMFDGCRLQPSIPIADIPEQLQTVRKLIVLREKILSASEAAYILGGRQLQPGMDFSAISTTIAFIESLQSYPFFVKISGWLLVPQIESRLQRLRDVSNQLKNTFGQFRSASEKFLAVADSQTDDWNFGANPGQRFPLETVQKKLESAANAEHALSEWLDYRRNRRALVEAGFEKLVEQVEEGTIPVEATAEAAKFIYYNSLLRCALEQFPLLAQFSGREHDAIRKRFAEIDKEVIQLTRKEISWKVDQRSVPQGNSMGSVSSYRDLGLINHLTSHPQARLKIRQLIERAGQALIALKPCFMMSPLTVAQFLPPGALNFDLIVMDEASQLRPEDALGAIARGSQVAVVEDRMQLPPTNFFNSVLDGAADGDNEDEGEDSSPTTDAESILDLAVQRYKPTRMLKWHYRSRHESLIAFSNKEFYNNDLIVFPSPSNAGELGLRFHYVEGGQYDQTRNQIEAQKVVAAVISHLKEYPKDSLGIVGLNLRQSELIRNLLDNALGQDPAAAEQYRRWDEAGEEVFVKNLETVQGDERDVIFLSATIGKNPQGQFPLTILGALNNKSYGHRRLNVLITRARKRVEVFSSVDPEEIPVTEINSWGARAVKDYLSYAKSGIMPFSAIPSGEPDSEFERMVAEELRKRGFEIGHQIGVASYRIDLGVRHPNRVGTYLLGIECDGATYHSSRSARDRDRLRQAVLEGLGWKIHRIWSTDWFRSRGREIERLVARIEELANA